MISAWRALDPKGHGRISYWHFSRAADHFGGNYDMKKLWMDLDSDEDGFVTLKDLDPGMAVLLKEFADVMVSSCGSAAAAWEREFSWSEHGRCQLDKFTRAARRLGYGRSSRDSLQTLRGTTSRKSFLETQSNDKHDAKAVFEALNADMCGVSFRDFELLDKWFKTSGSGGWHVGTLRSTLSTSDLSRSIMQAGG